MHCLNSASFPLGQDAICCSYCRDCFCMVCLFRSILLAIVLYVQCGSTLSYQCVNEPHQSELSLPTASGGLAFIIRRSRKHMCGAVHNVVPRIRKRQSTSIQWYNRVFAAKCLVFVTITHAWKRRHWVESIVQNE